MKQTKIAAIVVSSLFLLSVSAVPSKADAAGDVDNILLIGNSFVRGVKRPLKKFLKTRLDRKVKVKGFGPGIWHLDDHARSGRTHKVIQGKPWDYVLLQEHSSGISAADYPDVVTLDSIIKSSGAQTALFMTWREKDDPPSAYNSLKGIPGGNFGYIPIALQIDAPVAPVGWGVRNVVADGRPVALWKHGRHLNNRGRYLGACVVYAMLLQESPIGLPAPNSFGTAEVQYLQQIAHLTVLGCPEEWNITPECPGSNTIEAD